MPGACRRDPCLSQVRPALHAPATCPSHGCIPASPATVEGWNGTRAGHGAVEVKGRNLKEVRRAIQTGRCEFIQEYNENEFLKPSKDAPVIESIRFIMGEKLEDILSTYKAGRQHA